jgi:predicted anti-sigma-YlaC factor YlaD
MSLGLDGALSELEQMRLEVHLARCEDCRAYAAGALVTTGLLREAPLEQPEFPFVLPRRRRVSVRTLQTAAAAAAVALVVGLGTVALPAAQRPAPARTVQVPTATSAGAGSAVQVNGDRPRIVRVDLSAGRGPIARALPLRL